MNMGGITSEYYRFCQALYQHKFLFAWGTDLKNGFPSQEPEKDVAYIRARDEFRNDG